MTYFHPSTSNAWHLVGPQKYLLSEWTISKESGEKSESGVLGAFYFGPSALEKENGSSQMLCLFFSYKDHG